MGCCGARRQALRGRRPLATVPVPTTPAAPLDPVPVRYLGSTPRVLTGPASGLVYVLAPAATFAIDRADLDALMAAGWVAPADR